MNENFLEASFKSKAALAGRRSLMRRAGAGAAGLAAVSAAGVGSAVLTAQPAKADSTLDLEILNFALNLEYLESNFYLLAATGKPSAAYLSSGSYPYFSTGAGTFGTVTGGSAVPFALPLIQQYAQNLAADELAHTEFLLDVLGSSAVAQPKIDLGASFTNLGVAAGLIKQGQTFNPFADEVSFLLAGFIFEDVGVTAYGGAIGLISNPNYVTAAAAIATIEGYHSATIRTLLATIGAGVAVEKISNLRKSLSGADDDQGILMPNGNVNIAPHDSNALSFRRTPRQVLNIAYFAQNATSGGFFPSGVNGTVP